MQNTITVVVSGAQCVGMCHPLRNCLTRAVSKSESVESTIVGFQLGRVRGKLSPQTIKKLSSYRAVFSTFLEKR